MDRTVAIILGVIFGVLLVIVVPSLCIYRCTHAGRRHQQSHGRLAHHNRGHRFFTSTNKPVSTERKGRKRGEGTAGKPGEQGQPGEEGQGVVGNDVLGHKIRRCCDSFAARGSTCTDLEDVNDHIKEVIRGEGESTSGGAGTGGAAIGGLGGAGGVGGQGGKGGRGGQGGDATADAEAFASVYAFMMCCIHTDGGKGPRGPPGMPGMPGSQGEMGPPGPSDHYLSTELGLRPAIDIQTLNEGDSGGGRRIYIRNLNEGGSASGGKASGGKGGHGGQGGKGGLGGQGGRGGKGNARASASIHIYPQTMCCVFVRPHPDRRGKGQDQW